MDQSRRDLMRFGGLGFLGISTGIVKTPKGILLPHDKIINHEQVKKETMLVASGYLLNYNLSSQINAIQTMGLDFRISGSPIIRSVDTDLSLEIEPDGVTVHESFYDGGPMKVVIYR